MFKNLFKEYKITEDYSLYRRYRYFPFFPWPCEWEFIAARSTLDDAIAAKIADEKERNKRKRDIYL